MARKCRSSAFVPEGFTGEEVLIDRAAMAITVVPATAQRRVVSKLAASCFDPGEPRHTMLAKIVP